MKQRWPLLAISVERSVRVNFATTALISLFLIVGGGLWGIGAIYTYFAIEIALKANGEGAVAAVFFPLFMAPWAVLASQTSMKLLGEWLDLLAPGRELSNY